jgi:environmental stress-induced protein Ves
MALKTILKQQYLLMPWKNGQGSTAQIRIFPSNAPFPSDQFLWRLSTAPVKASGPFSVFPGCNRLLVVLSGQGLKLNDQELLPLKPLEFSGEFQIRGELIRDEIVDLGLIFRRGKVRAQMEVLEKLPEALKLDSSVKTHVLFCISGGFEVQGLKIGAGDCLQVEGEKEIALKRIALEGAKIIHIQISY